jgi:hypothetical protein
MEREDNLINKIKKGLIKSGFPLEMKVSKILKNNGWNHSMCNYYLDFESNVYREYDIHAEKRINGIDVMLFIECKKSDDKQVILYSPQNVKFLPFMDIYFKAFPKMPNYKEYIPDQKRQKDAFIELPIFDTKYRLSTGIIFSKGEKVEQDNSSFFGSINGLIKQSIMTGYDGLIETDFRMIFLYLLIYDGFMYELSPSDADDFALMEIEYGQYSYEYHFKPQIDYDVINQAFVKHMGEYGSHFVLELMRPSYFDKYLNKIENVVTNVDKDKLLRWGKDWPTVKLKKK